MPRKPIDSETDKAIRQAVKEGWTPKQLAATIHVSIDKAMMFGRVYGKAYGGGLSIIPRWTEEEDKLLMDLVALNKTRRFIQFRHFRQRTVSAIDNRIKYLNDLQHRYDLAVDCILKNIR